MERAYRLVVLSFALVPVSPDPLVLLSGSRSGAHRFRALDSRAGVWNRRRHKKKNGAALATNCFPFDLFSGGGD